MQDHVVIARLNLFMVNARANTGVCSVMAQMFIFGGA